MHDFSRILLTITCLYFCSISLKAAYRLEGIIHIDGAWQPKLYLSAINSFEDMNVASEELIINFASVAPSGKFVLEGNNLPDEDRLYRLHICKKGDPSATIIIGGKEENHIHLVMNNDAQITFKSASNSLLFKDYTLSGHSGNDLLIAIQSLKEYWKKRPIVDNGLSRDYNQQQLYNQLRYFADTCAQQLPALLALHHLDPNIDYPLHPNFYHDFMAKWSIGNLSPYFQELEQKIAFVQYQHQPKINKLQSILLWFLLIGLVLLLIGILFYKKYAKPGPIIHPTHKKLKELSIRERKVMSLIAEGKSNKEISNELNIGLSTVKSHAHKIYSKLGVKSRKEVVQFKDKS